MQKAGTKRRITRFVTGPMVRKAAISMFGEKIDYNEANIKVFLNFNMESLNEMNALESIGYQR